MSDRVLFLADQGVDVCRSEEERHPGGAELTDEVAIAACPFPLRVARTDDITDSLLSQFDLLVVANLARATSSQLAAIVRHGRYVLFEHDLRVCRWRGNFPACREPLHRLRRRCHCPHASTAALFAGALGVVYLTTRQRTVYLRNPFYVEPSAAVLGCSLFDSRLLGRVRRRGTHRRGTCVLYSPHAIKGTAAALGYSQREGLETVVLRDLRPERVLELFEASQRLVYLPTALEPAGRMPVEARILGCEVVVNGFVGVAGESWWRGDRSQALDRLKRAPDTFWRLVEQFGRSPARPARPRSLLRLAADRGLWFGSLHPIPMAVLDRAAACLQHDLLRPEVFSAW